MDRRKFVQALSVGGSFAWLGTRSRLSAQQTPGVYANPVPVVQDPSIAGLSEADVVALFTANAADPTVQRSVYPQSVASGDPNPNGVVLWTRVDPAAQVNPGLTQVAWEIAASPDFAAVLIRGVGALSSAQDNTVKLPIANSVLQPFTVYYYRFIFNQVPSRTGRFKTLPAAGTSLAQLRLGYVVCQDFGNGYYTAYQFLAQEEVDAVVHLGDYIYETFDSEAFQNNPARAVPPFPSGSTSIPVNVEDYRHLYKTYRGDIDLQAAHERFAFIQLWDDHEFANDAYQDFHPDNNAAPNSATTPQPDLRKAANQAWAEYGLADVRYDPAQSWDQSIRVYRRLSFGTLADLIVTDERLYRDGPPCGFNQVFQRYFSFGCGGLNEPQRTMLGAVQRQWFVDQMTTSQAVWKVWANEVMLMQLKFAGAIFINLDQWDGYPAERAALLTSIRDAGVQNVVALTGDLHTFLAGYLRVNFNNPFDPPVGVELMVGSISSANLAEGITSAIDLPSQPVPCKQFGVPPNLLDPLIRANNPHIRYWNSSTHGYGILTMTPAQLQCEFKAVTTIKSPTGARLVPLKTFTIPAGTVRID